MRCTQCNYRLWNLTSRQCPECGTPFVPSDFEFTINSVQFCCPSCNQSYYGTGESGHLVPKEFDCVTCGVHLHMDDMVLRPTEGIDESQTEADKMPWLNRSKLGTFSAWFKTVRMALVTPGKLMELVPVSEPSGELFAFAVVTTLAIALPTVLGFGILLNFSGAPLSGGCGSLCVFSIGLLFGMLLLTLSIHAVLRLTGQTQAGLERTFQAVCLSTGANIFSAIPCVGFYFGWIWWMISGIIMIKAGQKVSGSRATISVISPPVILLALVVLLTTVTSSTRVAAPAAVSTGPSLSKNRRVAAIARGISRYASKHAGQLPHHASELIVQHYIRTPDLIAEGSATLPSTVRIAGATIEEFEVMPWQEQREFVQQATDALPENTVAHRLGDIVFVYHGIENLQEADGRLWVALFWPDPATGLSGNPSNWTPVVRADGSYKILVVREFTEKLAEQNKIRLQAGLPALNHPVTITHSRPQIGIAQDSENSEATESQPD